MKQKDYQGAIDAYKESLRQNPNDDQTRYNLSEAIRQLKNKQKKENQQGNGGGNGDQNQDDNQGDQNNGEQNGNQNPQNGNGNGTPDQSGGNSDNKSEGTLPNKSVERMLDKLMKDEAETKRKVSGAKGKNRSPNSGKDW